MDKMLLKSIRVGKGLNQIEIAKELGITPKTYNHKENGKAEFEVSQVKRLANVLELSSNQIYQIFFQ